jgi:hypothetical protein
VVAFQLLTRKAYSWILSSQSGLNCSVLREIVVPIQGAKVLDSEVANSMGVRPQCRLIALDVSMAIATITTAKVRRKKKRFAKREKAI